MTRENPAKAFILTASDELHFAKIDPHLVAALRKVHEPCNYVAAATELGIPIGRRVIGHGTFACFVVPIELEARYRVTEEITRG